MTRGRRGSYSQEFRDALVKQMHEGISASQLSAETGVSVAALYRWRDKGIGKVSSAKPARTGERYTSADKFHVVMETYSMNEIEIAEYCRGKGIYPEQIGEWREICSRANEQQAVLHQQLQAELRDEKKSKAEIERELRRKEKALAEAAAILVLRKKAEAIWGVPEDE